MALDPITGAVDLAKVIVERIWPKAVSEAEKAVAVLEAEKLISQRDDVIIPAQRDIIVAEMQQGDNYTKRARPTIVYGGLAFIALIHVLLPILAWVVLTTTNKPLTNMPTLSLPAEFWYTWGGVCSIWMIGRSAEKRGMTNKVLEMITGNKNGK